MLERRDVLMCTRRRGREAREGRLRVKHTHAELTCQHNGLEPVLLLLHVPAAAAAALHGGRCVMGVLCFVLCEAAMRRFLPPLFGVVILRGWQWAGSLVLLKPTIHSLPPLPPQTQIAGIIIVDDK